jgi:predicted aldo/keto reductase-like oxidoreductase
MKEKRNRTNRRSFLKTMGAAGMTPALADALIPTGAIASPIAAKETQKQKPLQMPKRKLGKTKVEVPCLSFGTLRVDAENQILLRKTLHLGIGYWDTAYGYSNGNCELGIGKFLLKNPNVRKKLFLVTKASGAKTTTEIEERLQLSLKRLNTDYIDLYYAPHGASDPAQFTDELKRWAESAKKRKLIRFFGFSTHKNMAKCLAAAAKLDWIDVIMTSYNFQLMEDAAMKAAVEACYKAGIGLVAMKTQGRRQKTDNKQAEKLAKHFLERGFTEGQAKIKVVLEDKRFSSACVGMENIATVDSNVAAVLDKTRLTQTDRAVFRQYARATCDGYCAGCAHICDPALADAPYVSDIMRYLMYYNSYDDKDRARELFAQIPCEVRGKLLGTDYSVAEARCPQHLPIGKLVAEAVSKLA